MGTFFNQHILPGLKITLFLGVFLLSLFQPPGLLAESLEEGARREGKVLLYSGMNVPNSQKVVNAFQKKYPFIRAEYYRANEGQLLQKAVTEKQMGQSLADVLHMGGIWVNLYKKEGLLGRYLSPEAKFVLQGFKDQEGFWTAYYTAYYSFIYNTKMVAPKDLPKTYEELLQARWKRKIGLSLDDVEWYMGMLDLMGEEKGKQFMRRLSEQEPMLRNGRSLILNLMVAGEFPLSLGAVHTTREQQKMGAPIEILTFPSPTLAAPRMIGIQANAPHPNAAKLLVDYLLSKDGQIVVSQTLRNPIRMDVPVDPVIEKIMGNLLPIRPRDVESVQTYKRDWERIFTKR